MTEMKIELEMNITTFDITISNSKNDKVIVVKEAEKELKAKDVYDFLSYNKEIKYIVGSNKEKITDNKKKEYFSEIVKIFEDITTELNKLNTCANQDNSSSDSPPD